MATALDYRPPKPEDQVDPRQVAMMKQLGIWHPAMLASSQTPRRGGAAPRDREDALMAHIQTMLGQQDDRAANRDLRESISSENRTNRASAAQEAESGRNERANALTELKQQQADDRKAQGLLAAINIAPTVGKDPTSQALLHTYLQHMGVNVPPPQPDAKDAALRAFAGKPGTAAAPPATTGATTPVSQPTATPISQDTHFAANTPVGFDYNLGTGQYVPKSTPGTINGTPAGGATQPSQNVAASHVVGGQPPMATLNPASLVAPAAQPTQPATLTTPVAPTPQPATAAPSIPFQAGAHVAEGAKSLVSGLNPLNQINPAAPVVPPIHDFLRGLFGQGQPQQPQTDADKRRLATTTP